MKRKYIALVFIFTFIFSGILIGTSRQAGNFTPSEGNSLFPPATTQSPSTVYEQISWTFSSYNDPQEVAGVNSFAQSFTFTGSVYAVWVELHIYKLSDTPQMPLVVWILRSNATGFPDRNNVIGMHKFRQSEVPSDRDVYIHCWIDLVPGNYAGEKLWVYVEEENNPDDYGSAYMLPIVSGVGIVSVPDTQLYFWDGEDWQLYGEVSGGTLSGGIMHHFIVRSVEMNPQDYMYQGIRGYTLSTGEVATDKVWSVNQFAQSVRFHAADRNAVQITYVMRKVGDPQQDLIAYLYADNSGQPGSLLAIDIISKEDVPPYWSKITFTIRYNITPGVDYWIAVGTTGWSGTDENNCYEIQTTWWGEERADLSKSMLWDGINWTDTDVAPYQYDLYFLAQSIHLDYSIPEQAQTEEFAVYYNWLNQTILIDVNTNPDLRYPQYFAANLSLWRYFGWAIVDDIYAPFVNYLYLQYGVRFYVYIDIGQAYEDYVYGPEHGYLDWSDFTRSDWDGFVVRLNESNNYEANFTIPAPTAEELNWTMVPYVTYFYMEVSGVDPAAVDLKAKVCDGVDTWHSFSGNSIDLYPTKPEHQWNWNSETYTYALKANSSCNVTVMYYSEWKKEPYEYVHRVEMPTPPMNYTQFKQWKFQEIQYALSNPAIEGIFFDCVWHKNWTTWGEIIYDHENLSEYIDYVHSLGGKVIINGEPYFAADGDYFMAEEYFTSWVQHDLRNNTEYLYPQEWKYNDPQELVPILINLWNIKRLNNVKIIGLGYGEQAYVNGTEQDPETAYSKWLYNWWGTKVFDFYAVSYSNPALMELYYYPIPEVNFGTVLSPPTIVNIGGSIVKAVARTSNGYIYVDFNQHTGGFLNSTLIPTILESSLGSAKVENVTYISDGKQLYVKLNTSEPVILEIYTNGLYPYSVEADLGDISGWWYDPYTKTLYVSVLHSEFTVHFLEPQGGAGGGDNDDGGYYPWSPDNEDNGELPLPGPFSHISWWQILGAIASVLSIGMSVGKIARKYRLNTYLQMVEVRASIGIICTLGLIAAVHFILGGQLNFEVNLSLLNPLLNPVFYVIVLAFSALFYLLFTQFNHLAVIIIAGGTLAVLFGLYMFLWALPPTLADYIGYFVGMYFAYIVNDMATVMLLTGVGFTMFYVVEKVIGKWRR